VLCNRATKSLQKSRTGGRQKPLVHSHLLAKSPLVFYKTSAGAAGYCPPALSLWGDYSIGKYARGWSVPRAPSERRWIVCVVCVDCFWVAYSRNPFRITLSAASLQHEKRPHDQRLPRVSMLWSNGPLWSFTGFLL